MEKRYLLKIIMKDANWKSIDKEALDVETILNDNRKLARFHISDIPKETSSFFILVKTTPNQELALINIDTEAQEQIMLDQLIGSGKYKSSEVIKIEVNWEAKSFDLNTYEGIVDLKGKLLI